MVFSGAHQQNFAGAGLLCTGATFDFKNAPANLPDAIRRGIRVCGGCGVLNLNGPEVEFTLSVGWLCAVLGPKGRAYSVFNMQKN
jgi:hypothetical protein